MRTMGWVALSALVVSGCDDPASAPPPKPPTTKAVIATDLPPPPPPAPPAPLTDIPATSSSPEALATYRSAVDHIENGHPAEQNIAQLKKAIALDPSFASAIAYLGAMTPGAEGDALIASAIAKGAALPEPEKVYLQAAQAGHLGDVLKRAELMKKLADLLPASARVQYLYALNLGTVGNFDDSKAAFKKALDLNPDYAQALNELAYLEMYLGESDAAVGRLQKYVALRPKEPNAADSLGEALLLAGKLDDADASFKKALELDPKFTGASSGLAFVTLHRGDAKGLDTLTKYRDLPSLTFREKARAFYDIAWTQLGLGKSADALKTVDAWEADAKKTNDPEAAFWPPTARIEILLDAGKTEEALKQIAPLEARIVQSSAPASRKAEWRLYLHTDETIGNARLKKAADADKASALVTTIAAEVGGNEGKTFATIARGNALLAKGDAAAAAKEFSSCPNGESYCVWERMKAEERAGLKPQAAATRETLAKEHRRSGVSFFVWSKVASAKK